MKVPDLLQESYFPGLDGLRGIAILIVIAAHFGSNQLLRNTPFFWDSQAGVDIFFVLSGFLITTLLIKERIHNGKIDLRRFYLRRLLRILPVAYLFLSVLMILNIRYRLSIPAIDFAGSFLFFKNFPFRNEPFTAHFWTLSAEVQFYITFPLLLYYDLKRYTLAVVLLLAAVTVLCFSDRYNAVNANPASEWQWLIKTAHYIFWKGPVFILIGSLLSILIFKRILVAGPQRRPYFLSTILLASAILIRNKYFIGYQPYVSEFIAAWLIAAVIFISLKGNDFLSMILNSYAIRTIGIWSYSIYIWQELFIGASAWQPWMQVWKNCPLYQLMLIKLALTLLTGCFSYFFFERRFLRMNKRFR